GAIVFGFIGVLAASVFVAKQTRGETGRTFSCHGDTRYLFEDVATYRLKLLSVSWGKTKEASICTEPSPDNKCWKINNLKVGEVMDIDVVGGKQELAVWYREASPSGAAHADCSQGQVYSAANFSGNNGFGVSFSVERRR